MCCSCTTATHQTVKKHVTQYSDTSEEKEKNTYSSHFPSLEKIYRYKKLLPYVNLSRFSRLRDNHFKMSKYRKNTVTSYFHHQQIKLNGVLHIFQYLWSNIYQSFKPLWLFQIISYTKMGSGFTRDLGI